MAQLTNGSLTGKLGNVVGFVREGKNLFRVNVRRTAAPSEKELLNRYIFKLVQDWVTPLNPFIKLGFRNYSDRLWGANAAKSLIFKEALLRNGYDSYIDPSLVQLSAGPVPLPAGLQAEMTAAGDLEFSWDPSSEANASPRDRIMMLAYNPDLGITRYELSGAKRHLGRDRLPMASALPGSWHLYAAFVGEEGEGQSGSAYLGRVET